MRRALKTLPLTLAVLFALGGCGSDGGGDGGPEPAGSAGFPLTVQNCGERVTLDDVPQRVVLLGLDAVPLVDAVGALDRVVALTGKLDEGVYSEATEAKLKKIPRIDEGQDASGTVQVSREVVVAQKPDLVIGFEPEGTGITRRSLAESGIPLVVLPSFCPDPADIPKAPSFDDVEREIEDYGRLFDAEDEAKAAAAAVRTRLRSVETSSLGASGRTVATLFVFPDDTPPSAYGASSMSHAVTNAAGLTNVFGDVEERVFDLSFERILAKDPDLLILVTGAEGGSPEAVKKRFTELPGAKRLTAVRNQDILVQPFALTNLPTPLAVRGLENVAKAFAE